ncbi:MAG: ATP-binding protein [Acidobacteria bacterium]|nr:ATP-binding protein [Acidobacteriota bacterium]MBI3428284.1 ATP-binding protein [Acidobacteriota bacterium]
MIRLIEALNFRCLRAIQQPLGSFHVLVGPNASGKTTFLDTVSFLGHLVSEGLEYALNERTHNFQDMTWGRKGGKFELALEAAIPVEMREKLPTFAHIRYEISIGIGDENAAPTILRERVLLKDGDIIRRATPSLFPAETLVTESVFLPVKSGYRSSVSRDASGNVNFYSEGADKPGRGWINKFKLGARKSALGNLPEDETRYPASTWLKSLLAEGVQSFVLNSILIRKASPPNQAPGFRSDGSNLPWVIHNLEKEPARFQEWLAHLRTALPEIENVRTIEREDDRHRYLMVRYLGGLEVPSWMTSDGTLRLMALTIPAYLPGFKGVYLIEEPENGIHPRAVESVFQSLSSVYDAQMLLATHSPVVLSVADVKTVLCFAKTATGATDIVLGSEHPRLRDWRGATNLGELFAAGVLS